jgi:N-acetylmuramoyl-L-alanine amidase
MIDAIDRPSPNFNARMLPVSMVVLHYTGMEDAESAIRRLEDPEAKVSAHYVVDEDGQVIRMVPEEHRAWHAGNSYWRGITDVNSASVGIEIVNPGHEFGYRPFPEAQMDAVVRLVADVKARHAISRANVVGHSDVAPARKQDPGELFDWPRLAAAGIGLWPEGAAPREAPVGEVQALLARYGYAVPQSGALDPATVAVISAFQRHFRPSRFDGVPDAETIGRLTALVRLLD